MYDKILSTEEFATAKAEMVGNDPVMYRMKMSDLKITRDDYENNRVQMRGTRVGATDSFYKGLMRALNITDKMTGGLMAAGRDGSKQSAFVATLLDALKDFQSFRKDSLITVYGDGSRREIYDMYLGQPKRLGNEDLFGIAERLLNEYSDLGIRAINYSAESGVYSPLEIMLSSSKQQDMSGEFGADEVFNFGLSLRNTPTGTQQGDFMYRLVCANGMTGMRTEYGKEMKGVDAKEIGDLYSNIYQYAAVNWMPSEFRNNLQKAIAVPASLFEVKKAYDFAAGAIDEQIPQVKEALLYKLKKDYFWGMEYAMKRFEEKKIDVNQLETEHLKFTKTNMKVWDLVNSMTFLGSHNMGFGIGDGSKASLSKQGGKMFAGKHDLTYASMLYL